MNDVRIFKLISGEEIIARYAGTNQDGNHLIEKPLAVIAQPNHQTQQVQIGFAPWCVGNDKITETVLRDCILALDPYEANPELEKGYMQTTSSIALP